MLRYVMLYGKIRKICMFLHWLRVIQMLPANANIRFIYYTEKISRISFYCCIKGSRNENNWEAFWISNDYWYITFIMLPSFPYVHIFFAFVYGLRVKWPKRGCFIWGCEELLKNFTFAVWNNFSSYGQHS